MSWPDFSIVLLAICELVGVGLLGAVVLRLLRRFPVVVPFAGVIVITVVAMVTSTVLLSAEQPTAGPVVLGVAGVMAIVFGLVLGVPVMRDGQHLVRGRVEVQQLAEAVDELFAPTRIQAGGVGLQRTRVGLGDLVGEAITGAGVVADACGVRLWSGWVESAVVTADRAEIARAVDNLLVNAIHCGRGGGTVSVDAWAGQPWATVSVRGEAGGGSEQGGKPLSEVDPGGLGSCAYRGAGLRLAIVQGVARAHNGELSVREVPGGCCFELRLPAASVS